MRTRSKKGTKWRVTAIGEGGRRIATRITFDSELAAKLYACRSNHYNRFRNARVVKDSEQVRKMIP
jgi:hypothetical protein